MIKVDLHKNRIFIAVYEIVMVLLAILVVAILVIELLYNLPRNIAITLSIIDNIRYFRYRLFHKIIFS